MDKYPISASSLEKFYYVDGHQLERQYKEHLSDYLNWKDKEQGEHADTWLVFPQNVGPRMSIDETSLSDGELYAIVSNKDAKGKRGALAAIVLGTKLEDVIAALKNIDQGIRKTVTEITLDLSSSMRKIAHRAFPKAVQVTDRFHVQKLAMVGAVPGELTHVSCPSVRGRREHPAESPSRYIRLPEPEFKDGLVYIAA